MLIYNPPHGKSIRVPKTFAIRAIRVQKKSVSIRVHLCAKNIRAIRYSCSKKNPCSSVCAKNIHRLNTRLYLFYVVFTFLKC